MTTTVMIAMLFVLTLAVATGSVLLLGYVAAGASLLLIGGVLIRKAVRRRRAAVPLDNATSRWLDEREAA